MFLDITGVLQAFLCSKSRRKAKCEKGGRSRCQVVGMYSYIWKRNSSSAFSAKHAKCFQTYFTYLYYSNFLHLMFKHPEILFFLNGKNAEKILTPCEYIWNKNHTQRSKNVCRFRFSVQKNLQEKCINSHGKIVCLYIAWRNWPYLGSTLLTKSASSVDSWTFSSSMVDSSRG